MPRPSGSEKSLSARRTRYGFRARPSAWALARVQSQSLHCSRRTSPPKLPSAAKSSPRRGWVRRRAPLAVTVVARSPTLMKPVDIATDEQWSVVFDGMEGAVSPSGTAHVAGAGAKYKWAGKTGTAQVVTVKQTESTKHKDVDERKREHAWFIAFAPADDPKIAISV